MRSFHKKLVSLLLALVLSAGLLAPIASADFEVGIGYYGPVQRLTLDRTKEELNKRLAAPVDIKYDEDISAFRLYYLESGLWYLNSNGSYPYTPATGDVPAELPDVSNESANRWVDRQKVDFNGETVVLSKDNLSATVSALAAGGADCSLFEPVSGLYAIIGQRGARVYCDSKGRPFVAVDDRSVTNVDFDYIYNDNSVDNSQHLTVDDIKILDINNNTMNLINDKGETTNYTIESLYYDASSKSYTANVYDTTYNVQNNCYEYNYYTYNISYNIQYSYVTYIGSSAEYQKEFEYYFELPDGRSSADLTAEELAGMNIDFDVVNYDHVSIDNQTYALFPFDGTSENKAYTSVAYPNLTWSQNPSLTYLDSGNFGGALYLDGLSHAFSFTAGKFPMYKTEGNVDGLTIQFRYYVQDQGGNNISSLYVTGSKNGNSPCTSPILAFKGNSFAFVNTTNWSPSKATFSPLPFGTWNDICVSIIPSSYAYHPQHPDYTYLLYINGLLRASWTTPASASWNYAPFHRTHGNTFENFSFKFNEGSLNQTSNPSVLIDNLRVARGALYSGQSQFIPSPVPFDTDLVHVLPDEDGLKDLTIAVRHNTPVDGFRVGSVRPTFPNAGLVWFPVESNRITDCQIYNGSYWESVDCRLWTGVRWIPLWAFNVFTLSDCFDIADGEGLLPPITTETGFWSWWQKEWLDFRAWFTANSDGSGGGPIIFPPMSDCEHTYTEKVLTAPTCTMKGSALYTCSKCGDSYTDTLNANGHDWLMKESIPDELGEDGAVLVAGYDLYICSVCGEEYKDYARTGPPGEEDGSTLTQLIQQLFESLGGLVGSLIDWVLELAVDAVKGFGDLGDYFKEKAGEIEGFGGEFIGFLGAFFAIIPPEIMTCLSLALVLLGLTLFIRKVLLS